MNSSQITLQSVTGVDVEMHIAGPGSRSYAFVIDWHIRFIVAVAWFFTATFIYTGSFAILSGGGGGSFEHFVLISIAPALAIYFLYHPILEVAMHGRTPGKRMAGVRIVTRTGDIPGLGPLLIRNLFRIVDSLPTMYVVGLVCVVLTSQHVRIGDLAAGTLLVLDRPESDMSFANLGGGALDARSAEVVQELLERWDALGDAERVNIARSLVTRLEPASTDAVASEDGAQLRERLQRLLAAEKTT